MVQALYGSAEAVMPAGEGVVLAQVMSSESACLNMAFLTHHVHQTHWVGRPHRGLGGEGRRECEHLSPPLTTSDAEVAQR